MKIRCIDFLTEYEIENSKNTKIRCHKPDSLVYRGTVQMKRRLGNSHHNVKTVLRLSQLYNGNIHTFKIHLYVTEPWSNIMISYLYQYKNIQHQIVKITVVLQKATKRRLLKCHRTQAGICTQCQIATQSHSNFIHGIHNSHAHIQEESHRRQKH